MVDKLVMVLRNMIAMVMLFAIVVVHSIKYTVHVELIVLSGLLLFTSSL